MVWYDLAREPHGPVGGGSFNVDDIGSESNNFREYKGRLYGYVQPPGAGFTLSRIAPRTTQDSLDDVLVLAYATVPGRGGQHLVGWYGGARCYAESQGNRPGRLYGIWNFEAPADRAVLLPLGQRTLAAPTRHEGGFGQALIRYAHDKDGRIARLAWMDEAVAFVRRYRGENLLTGADPGELPDANGSRVQGWQSNPAARKAVEMHAMSLAAKFFRAKGYTVDAEVHRYHPYDLLCTHRRTGEALRVEVKGTTEAASSVMVTTGEVRSARADDLPTALFVVSEIELRETAKGWGARGGRAGWVPRWVPQDRHLEPTAYRYRLPRLHPTEP